MEQNKNQKDKLLIIAVVIFAALLIGVLAAFFLVGKKSGSSKNTATPTATVTVTQEPTVAVTTDPTETPVVTVTQTPIVTVAPTEINYKLIEKLDYKALIPINSAAGDSYITPEFKDLTGDNYIDGIFGYKTGGTGGYLNLYVYSNTDGNPKRIFQREGISHGSYTITPDKQLKVTEISQGTNGSVSTKTYKWSPQFNSFVDI